MVTLPLTLKPPGEFYDQGTMLKKNITNSGRPTSGLPIGRPGVVRPKGVSL
jgi:hypothetical protein